MCHKDALPYAVHFPFLHTHEISNLGSFSLSKLHTNNTPIYDCAQNTDQEHLEQTQECPVTLTSAERDYSTSLVPPGCDRLWQVVTSCDSWRYVWSATATEMCWDCQVNGYPVTARSERWRINMWWPGNVCSYWCMLWSLGPVMCAVCV